MRLVGRCHVSIWPIRGRPCSARTQEMVRVITRRCLYCSVPTYHAGIGCGETVVAAWGGIPVTLGLCLTANHAGFGVWQSVVGGGLGGDSLL
ncbi:hypothetical protein LX36DRAFT_387662 [Colletotrichum falcatum]|nr:hypothetical protein LX36DRAFT_387662 [Colletotrichum falcatum]